MHLKVVRSLRRLGIVVSGADKNKRMSSAKATSLWVCFAIVNPLNSGLNLRHLSRGSRVRTKIRGDKGQPWRVLFKIDKAFNR